MANTKLFKKLNEQVEINKIKNIKITESEKASVEKKLIFEGLTAERIQNLNFEDKSQE